MPITFDTLEELQEFYLTFKLENAGKSLTSIRKAKKARVGRPKGATVSTGAKKAKAGKAKPAAKRGRPPAAKTATKAKAALKPARKTAKPGVKKAAKPVAKLGAKRGPKPRNVVSIKSRSAARPAAAKARNNGRGDTLTGKIRSTIQKFLDSKKSFTANDIYADISQRDKAVNKQSVITSVLKQMNSTFKTIAVTERPGAGPRAVKLYNP